MERNDLLKILNGDISHIDLVNMHDIALADMEVKVMPKHVKKMLEYYLAHKISANNLTRWAYFICMRTEYCSDHNSDDKIADYYEDMLYVVQKLSTPEIDGEVNENTVKSYLTELAKYF